MTGKTLHQRRTARMHGKIIRLYRQLSDDDKTPRTVVWDEISRRTGYTRQGIYRVLRANGIEYSTKHKNKEKDGNETQD